MKVGVVSAHPKGFGFITTEIGEEYFVPPALMRTMLPGDRVSFAIEAGKQPGQFQVARASLVERRAGIWLGTVSNIDGYWRLEPDEPCFVKMNLRGVTYIPPGMVVAVRVPTKGAVLTEALDVSLERVLGERFRKGFDVDYALAKFDFAPGFAPAALTQAAKLPREIEPIELLRSDRKDLRAAAFVTIDGESTRDFDDAVLAKAKGDGFLIQVAIADVSHYVKPGSPLDRDARERATSVYLPGKTVPMLPEALSNGLCSLNPDAERLTVVASIDMGADGQVRSCEFFRAIITSKARLTYKQVTDILEKGAAVTGAPAVAENLATLHAVYKLLDAQRKARGVMEFEDAEPKLVIGEDGEMRLTWEYRTMAHKLVEELMLLANRCVAQKLYDMHGEGLFRHQPLPPAEDWAELVTWATARGLTLPAEPSLRALAELACQAHSPEEASIVELRVRQVMQQAQYDTREPSHFSLGFASYAHFTSPIRRYADLTVHRLLLGQVSIDEALRETAADCSERARSARLAERQVWDRLKKRILARDVAKDTELEAKVVFATGRRGIRVVIDAWQCAALVPAENLLEEGYNFNADSQAWVKAGKAVEPGVRFTVRWTALEEDRGRTELTARLV
jgi:ribonuclease R